MLKKRGRKEKDNDKIRVINTYKPWNKKKNKKIIKQEDPIIT